MRLFHDIDYGFFTAVRGGSSPLRRIEFKVGDQTTVEVEFFRSGTAYVPAVVNEMIFVIKDSYAAVSPALAAILTADWAVEAGIWSATINTNTTDLRSALASAASIARKAELTVTLDGLGPFTSATLAATITNDLWKGEEATPLTLPTPTEWLLARQAALTSAGADPNLASFASGTLSLNNPFTEGNFQAGDPLTVGAQVFSFRNVMDPIVDPLRINIGADFAATMATLVAVVTAESNFVASFTAPSSLELTSKTAGSAGNVIVSHSHASEITTTTLAGGVAAPTATHLGQLCRASTAWWIWNGTAWIPWATLNGSPIAYNATLSAYRKLTVSGADGSEIITISSL